jgi:hypothetical protein
MNGREVRRLLSLVLRDLGAVAVRVAEPGEVLPPGDPSLVSALPGGRTLVVELPPDAGERAPLQARLDALVASFQETWASAAGEAVGRVESAESELTELLRDVATEASALDALVIDADSPMVWASAASGHGEAPRRAVLKLVRDDEGDDDDDASRASEPPAPELTAAAKRAISAVRALPELEAVHRGGHLNHTIREPDFGLVVRSFASLYLLVLVYEAPFDQLAAERAVAPALPVIERLVLSLPPPDAPPTAGVAAMRPRRRR